MPTWLALIGTIVLCTVGAYTAIHPNGGYRAVGGVGSGLSPSTRRAAGITLIVFALVVFVMVLADAA